MIKAILAFFGISPLTLFVAAAVAAAAGLFALNIYDAGVSNERDRWVTAIAQEKERIRKENEAALDESRRRIAELNALLAKLEEDLRNAEEEARLDPNAGRVCLGTGSVQRLNRIH